MSVGTVLTLGYGVFGNVNFIPTLGYGPYDTVSGGGSGPGRRRLRHWTPETPKAPKAAKRALAGLKKRKDRAEDRLRELQAEMALQTRLLQHERALAEIQRIFKKMTLLQKRIDAAHNTLVEAEDMEFIAVLMATRK